MTFNVVQLLWWVASSVLDNTARSRRFVIEERHPRLAAAGAKTQQPRRATAWCYILHEYSMTRESDSD
jgi:hypothetical protein